MEENVPIYILRNKKYFIGTLCTSLFAGVVPLFLAYVIQLISDVAFNNHFEKAGTCLFASVLFLVYTLMTTSANSIMKSTYRKKLKTDLGEDLYSSLMNQSYSTFKKEKIGNQLSLFTNDGCDCSSNPFGAEDDGKKIEKVFEPIVFLFRYI